MPLDSKLYVGDLPRDVSEKELERAFNYYGPLRNVWIARNPPGFAFVEFEDSRDADDAVRSLDGANVCGARVRVEHSTGKVRPKHWQQGGRRMPPPQPRRGGGGGGGGGGGFNPNDRCYECGERGHYAYDCRRRLSGGGGRGGRRSRSRSRSGSRDRRTRSRSRTHSRSRSRSAGRSRRNRSKSASRSRSRSKPRADRSPVNSNHATSPPKDN